eukprot:1146293-Pelagomonas_calceolata.AAC.3
MLVVEELKYCEDTRPGAQLEATQLQHSEVCKQLQGAENTLHKITLGVGGNVYNAQTLDQFEKLGIDLQRSTRLAQKPHAHAVQFAHKLTSTRHAIETKKLIYNYGALGLCAARNPPNPH